MKDKKESKGAFDLAQASSEEISLQERALFSEFQDYTRAICEVVYAETAEKLHKSLDTFQNTVNDFHAKVSRDMDESAAKHGSLVSTSNTHAEALIRKLSTEVEA